MKFISARRLAVFFEIEYSGINDALLLQLQNATQHYFKQHKTLEFMQQDFTFQEVNFMLNQLEIKENRVFHYWIEKDKKLVDYLFTNGESVNLQNDLIVPKAEPLWGAYQNFLVPYLSPVLTDKINFSIQELDFLNLEKHLKFCSLLPRKQQIIIQQPIKHYLNQYLSQIKLSKKEELESRIQHIYNPDFVVVLNSLNKYFYNEWVMYFKTAQRIVENNTLSPLTLEKIRLNVLKINFNPEELKQVKAFFEADHYTSKSKPTRSTLNNMVRSPLFYVAVMAILINFIFFYPLESKNERKHEVKQKESVVKDSLLNEEK